jgi:DNA-binding transcriptional LysR family regulator
MHLSLRQLSIFASVARHLSYTRAAEEMHLTQPAVFTQVKQLEESVGLPLLERVGKRLYLTDAGVELEKTCRRVLEELERFEMQVAETKGLKQGKLRLTVVTTAKYFAPRLLGEFCTRYPGVEAALKVTNREGALQRFHDNLDDLYILGQPPEGMDAVAAPFLDNPLVALAAGAHPLAREKNISLERLAREPFLMREPGSGTRLVLERLMKQHHLRLNVRMELGSNEAIKQAILGGLGVSVLSRHSLAEEDASGRLAILDVEGFPIRRQWYVVYPASKQPSVVAQAFLDFLKTQAPTVPAPTARKKPKRG